MLKLYKKLRARDWAIVIAIIGFTVLQVYCTMSMVDFTSGIISSITYLNYHNNPSQMSEAFLGIFNSVFGGDWANVTKESLKQFADLSAAAGQPIAQELLDMILNVANASTTQIWWNGGMMLLVALSAALVQAIISALASYVAAHTATLVRKELNDKVMGFSLAEVNKFSTPSLITRVTNDVTQVQMANLLVMRMVFSAPITAIWALCKIQSSSGELTIATAVAIVVLLLSIGCIMLIAMPKFKSMQKIIDRLNTVTRENLTGIRVVHAYNAESYQEGKFKEVNDHLTKTQLFTGRIMSLFSPIMMLILNGVSLAMYWIGASLINKGTIDFATVTSFMLLASQIIMAFVMLLMMFIMWPRASVSAKRINEVLDTDFSIKDTEKPKERIEEGTVAFNDVSFRYPDAENSVIEHISFEAKKGETVAFIGATGSGKSTLINLVTRLYDVSEGSVTVDGVDVRDLTQQDLRSVIGYVPQKGVLFSGTVEENIAFGNPKLSKEDAIKAAKVACADSFINEMEKGYDSPIAQGGQNVSGGQKQRLCIARAVAIKPEILVFDDSFSALDYKTDKVVRENLAKEAKDVTKLIVAQRIGTIMNADSIIVLEEGKMVGKGKHADLLRDCPVYREIALSQLSKEELGL